MISFLFNTIKYNIYEKLKFANTMHTNNGTIDTQKR